MTAARRVLPSTTSHKQEPLLATLEVFARLGMCDIDLNLHHILKGGVPVDLVLSALDKGGQRIWMASGGWCDFYHSAPQIEETFRSVERQVTIARQLGVDTLRLFFGRLKREAYSPAALDVIRANLRRLSDRYPDVRFNFENHDGASLRPEVCREILEAVDRPNIRMNFDPINFEHAGVDSSGALRELRPLVKHVHLKGLERGETCEFGSGDVDLVPLLRSLLGQGYDGMFTVEYEGRFDRTLRLYQGFQRARAVLDAL